MSRAFTVEVQPSTTAVLESKSPTSVESGASNGNKEQGTGSTNSIRLAEKVRDAIEKANGYELYIPKTWQTKEEGAATLLSIGSPAYKVLYNDIRAWSHVYGTAPAVFLATFGRKSVWKMQAELLGRPGRPGPGGLGDPDDPDDPDDPEGLGGAWGRRGTNDPAAEEYKRTIETESQRIGVSVCISN